MENYTAKATFEQDAVFEFYKQRGETLAVLLQRFRYEKAIGDDVKITYAGRLDPAAEGLMILLVGKARFEKEYYLGFAKVYETEIIFGLNTDTLDLLGVIVREGIVPKIESIEKTFKELPDSFELPYPLYSSRTVQGRPLFVHARSGTAVVVPKQKIKIYKKEFLKSELVTIENLAEDAVATIATVAGDFRQEEITVAWKKFSKENQKKQFLKCTLSFTVGSGTYIRSLAQYLGEKTGTVAYAHRIKRISFQK